MEIHRQQDIRYCVIDGSEIKQYLFCLTEDIFSRMRRKKRRRNSNVIKIIVSMTKKKPTFYIQNKQVRGFHVFMDFSIMSYGYFPIRFHVPNVNIYNRNECLSVRTFGTVCELVAQTEKYHLRIDLIPVISEKRPSKPITILHIIPGIANIGGNYCKIHIRPFGIRVQLPGITSVISPVGYFRTTTSSR